MKKRIAAMLLAMFMIVELSACTGIFQKEYLSVSEYEDDPQTIANSDIARVYDYAGLKNAIISMVVDHRTEGKLRFTDYDGNIQGDLSQALLEVKAENALAGFAVNYMSSNLSSIMTYYEATVYIKYKRTQTEIDDIEYISGKALLADAIEPLMDEMGSYLALRITSASITQDEVVSAINSVYSNNPAICVVQPNVTVTIYPEIGLQRIIEIELEYGWKTTELQKMKLELNERIQTLSERAYSIQPEDYARSLYGRLAQSCSYDPTGNLRSGRSELNSGLGATAYGALVEKLADSRGLAAAYSALCYQAGIECEIIDGLLDGEEHSWNMIELGGRWYHVDASAYYSAGLEQSFSQTDSQMLGRYEWDAEKYPVCEDDAEASETDLVQIEEDTAANQ